MSEISFDGDLTIAQPEERLIPTADPKCTVEPKGIIRPDDLHIFIPEPTLREIVDYSATDRHHELGGVLIGGLYSYKGIRYVLIDGYIKARLGVGTAASFRFTHDAWAEITKTIDGKYPGRLIVGWHHTHPGYGIFLSGYDMFIHKHFFNLPHNTALVVDPKAETLGFFQWRQGRIAQCGFYFVR